MEDKRKISVIYKKMRGNNVPHRVYLIDDTDQVVLCQWSFTTEEDARTQANHVIALAKDIVGGRVQH